MKDPISKLLRLLAATDWSEREIYELCELLRREHPEILADHVVMLRREMREMSRHLRPRREKYDRPEPTATDVARRVEKLLRHEARLSVPEAASILIEALVNDRVIGNDTLRPPNREGFVRWLSRLEAYVPSRQLLHYATQIRNAYVHGRDTDWPLKGGDQ